jgi:hypothetical protein
MRTLLASTVALGAFTSASPAEPLALNDAQMDALTAGQVAVDQSNSITANFTQSNTSDVSAEDASVSQSKSIEATSASFISIMPSARGPIAMTALSTVLICEFIP